MIRISDLYLYCLQLNSIHLSSESDHLIPSASENNMDLEIFGKCYIHSFNHLPKGTILLLPYCSSDCT